MEHKKTRLVLDLERMALLQQRRDVLRMLGVAAAIPIVGCGSNNATHGASDGNTTGGNVNNSNTTGGNAVNGNATDANNTGTTSACSEIPEETEGPYPGDGSNGPNVLTQSGVVRSDITSSFGSYTGTAAGVPLTLTLKLVSLASGCTTPVSRAVYIWHCDQSGNYSLYGAANQNYLRGVQATDANGEVTFQTIWPACYAGRWPHIHFEIYPSLSVATSATAKSNTSQLAMPATICNEVFATSGYSASVQNFQNVSLSSDMVFSDGATLETPAVTGNVTDGFVCTMQVSV